MPKRIYIQGIVSWTAYLLLLLFASEAPFAEAALPLIPVVPDSLYAEAANLPGDPDLCAKADPNEQSLGGFVYYSKLSFPQGAKFNDLYSRLVITTKICTPDTLSSNDRTALRKVLNTLAITDAKTFLATLDVTFTAAAGPKFPSLVPFSYAFDESKNTYIVQEEIQRNLPWQTTDHGYSLTFAYSANKQTSIVTGKLASGIISKIVGANPTTA
jgi:hypothetical protein